MFQRDKSNVYRLLHYAVTIVLKELNAQFKYYYCCITLALLFKQDETEVVEDQIIWSAAMTTVYNSGAQVQARSLPLVVL